MEGVEQQTVRQWIWEWNSSGGRRGLRRRAARIRAGIHLEDYAAFAARRGTIPTALEAEAKRRGWL